MFRRLIDNLKRFHWVIPTVALAAIVFIEQRNVMTFLDVISDEGVYLYAAHLLTQGFIPYQDFFLAHPPFLITLVALIFSVIGTNIILFHILYSLWVFSMFYPIYFIALKLSRRTIVGVLVLVLLMTYVSLVLLDGRQFALRPASLPFFAWGSYFLVKKYRPVVAGIFLAAFAFATVSNVLLACVLIVLFVACQLLDKKSLKEMVTDHKWFIVTFGVLVCAYYLAVFLIPHAYDNFIGFQIGRDALSYDERIVLLKTHIKTNWPLFFFGLTSILIRRKETFFLALWNVSALLIITFAGNSLYEHYYIILAVGLALGSVITMTYLFQQKLGVLVIFAVCAGVYLYSYKPMQLELVKRKTPALFTAVEQLRPLPEPLLSLEPMYGLLSNRKLTYSYYVADMRAFGTLHKKIDDPDQTLIARSNTILVGPWENPLFTKTSIATIERDFALVYKDYYHAIYVRRGVSY